MKTLGRWRSGLALGPGARALRRTLPASMVGSVEGASMEPSQLSRPGEEATTRIRAGQEPDRSGPAGPGAGPGVGAGGGPGQALQAGAVPRPGAGPSAPAPSGDPLVGLVVAGRYRLLAPLATGGMGSVYRAEQLTLKRQVAVKLMVDPGEELIERYRREAVALSEVSHPAIVEIFDFETFGEGTDARCCLVMAFIDGRDLADYLDTQPLGYLEPQEVRALALPIVSALVELHANGILHRDIKPDNIVRFLRADGRAGVKLVDFGIARRQVDQGMTASGYVLGTPPYLPPETMLGEKHTPLSDIYALGATMFELLTGTPPYGSGSAAEIMQKALAARVSFPPDLEATPLGQLLRRMLSRRPSQRPDAMEVLQRLEALRCDEECLEPAPSGVLPTRPLPIVGRGRAARGAAPSDAAEGVQGSHTAALTQQSRPAKRSGRALPSWALLLLGALLGGGAVALAWMLVR